MHPEVVNRTPYEGCYANLSLYEQLIYDNQTRTKIKRKKGNSGARGRQKQIGDPRDGWVGQAKKDQGQISFPISYPEFYNGVC